MIETVNTTLGMGNTFFWVCYHLQARPTYTSDESCAKTDYGGCKSIVVTQSALKPIWLICCHRKNTATLLRPTAMQAKGCRVTRNTRGAGRRFENDRESTGTTRFFTKLLTNSFFVRCLASARVQEQDSWAALEQRTKLGDTEQTKTQENYKRLHGVWPHPARWARARTHEIEAKGAEHSSAVLRRLPSLIEVYNSRGYDFENNGKRNVTDSIST